MIFIVHQLSSREDAELFAKHIYYYSQHHLEYREIVSASPGSVGISLFPINTTVPEHALLRDADMAMYKAKRNGKNGYLFFNDSIREEVLAAN